MGHPVVVGSLKVELETKIFLFGSSGANESWVPHIPDFL
jgi:hypothetical protein